MGDTKDEIYRQINVLYEKFDSKNVRNTWYFIIGASIFLDIVLSIKKVDTLFSHQNGTIVAIAVVIWTFTTSIFVYCLGKVDQKYYGIQVADIFVKGLHANKIYSVAVTAFAEIPLLVIMSIFGVGIAVFVLTLFQCYLTIYIILMVLQRTSGEFATSQIKGEIEAAYRIEFSQSEINDRDTSIFRCMLHNINYDSYDEAGKLLEMLRHYNRNFERQINKQIESGVRKYINECSKEIARHIYMNKKAASQKVVMDWFREAGSCIEIKQGILMHILEECETGYGVESLEKLLNSETRDYRKLHIWVFVYSVYLHEFEGEDWRAYYIEYLMRKMRFGTIKTDAGIAIGYWNQITDAENLYSLLRYLF